MKMKKLLAVAIAATLCCTISVPAYASVREYEAISPQYIIADAPIAGITVSGTMAVCTGYLKCTCTGSSAEMVLQKKSTSGIWSNVNNASWTKTANSKTLTISSTKSGLSKGTYRTKAVFTITTTDGQSETVTVYSEEKDVV